MHSTVRNTLIAGAAALAVAIFFVFVRLEDHQALITEAQSLYLSAILETPERYDSLNVAVTGFLLWHPSEPTLFANEAAFRQLDFERSIQLETATGTDFGFADEKPVVVSGTFLFTPEKQKQFRDYKGVFWVDSIVTVVVAPQ